MKKYIFTFFVLALPIMLAAQVGIKMELNRKDFMLYEPIYACVTLRNDSGKALLFGSHPKLQGFVLFDIRNAENEQIKPRKDVELNVTGLYLGPGEVKSITIPIQKYYDLDKTGVYLVNVYVSHNLLDGEYQPPQGSFIRIHSGYEVKRLTVGMPDLTGNNQNKPAESRTYSIRALDINGERYYYLVVEDDKNVYGVTHIGYQYGQNNIHVYTDMLSRIHLLVPMSHKVFHYLTFGLDGTNIESSYWKKSTTIPSLYRDPRTGKVSRIGGSPARPGVDFHLSDQKRYTTVEINEEYSKLPKANSGIVDIGRNVGND